MWHQPTGNCTRLPGYEILLQEIPPIPVVVHRRLIITIYNPKIRLLARHHRLVRGVPVTVWHKSFFFSTIRLQHRCTTVFMLRQPNPKKSRVHRRRPVVHSQHHRRRACTSMNRITVVVDLFHHNHQHHHCRLCQWIQMIISNDATAIGCYCHRSTIV